MIITVRSVTIEPINGYNVSVEIDDKEVMEEVSVSEFISFRGANEIMSHLDIDDVKAYFNLTDQE